MGKGKRGGTQVGFVLSFVIFITFIIVIYSVLIVPNLNQEDKRSLVDNLKIKLLENVSGELAVVSINTESAPQNCIRIQNFLGNFNTSSRLVAKDKFGVSQKTYVLGSDLEISRNSNETFFKVYESGEFDVASAVGETPCNPRSYETGNAKREVYIFEKKIISLMGNYQENYESVRDGFNFPDDSDFDFGFKYSNETHIKVERQTTLSIYSVEIPIQYVDGNASILSGFVNIRVW